MFLYQKVHYVYNLGVGESYFMELLTIVVGSLAPPANPSWHNGVKRARER